MMVVVSEDGKMFHAAGCPFIHEKAKLRRITAAGKHAGRLHTLRTLYEEVPEGLT